METWKAIIVGIVQGLAEFLPISSSGHIVLTQFLLGIEESGIAFEIILHVGTLLSVIVYFHKRLFSMLFSLWTPSKKEDRSWIWMLGLATIPAVIAVKFPMGSKTNAEGVSESVSLGDYFEKAYDNPVLVSGLLLVTGGLLLVPKILKPKAKELTWKSALMMGVGQAIAILPGISRSGSSITAGLLAGVNPKKAAEFSFLMSIPAIVGAVVFKLDEFKEAFDSTKLVPYLSGAVAAFISGLFAVFVVLEAIRKGKFEYFAYYCFAAGISGLIYFSVF